MEWLRKERSLWMRLPVQGWFRVPPTLGTQICANTRRSKLYYPTETNNHDASHLEVTSGRRTQRRRSGEGNMVDVKPSWAHGCSGWWSKGTRTTAGDHRKSRSQRRHLDPLPPSLPRSLRRLGFAFLVGCGRAIREDCGAAMIKHPSASAGS
jgi:hypothetical protein